MPVTPKPLASAIMVPTRSVMVPTTAGHAVRFQQGMATINDTHDLAYLMRRSDVRIHVSEYAMSWMDEVLSEAGVVKAQVQWPMKLEEPEPDPIEEAIKDKPRWRKPPSNSSES